MLHADNSPHSHQRNDIHRQVQPYRRRQTPRLSTQYTQHRPQQKRIGNLHGGSCGQSKATLSKPTSELLSTVQVIIALVLQRKPFAAVHKRPMASMNQDNRG